jgi:hypothetical protein
MKALIGVVPCDVPLSQTQSQSLFAVMLRAQHDAIKTEGWIMPEMVVPITPTPLSLLDHSRDRREGYCSGFILSAYS